MLHLTDVRHLVILTVSSSQLQLSVHLKAGSHAQVLVQCAGWRDRHLVGAASPQTPVQ